MSERTFIIVGASLAGAETAEAAEELRERGFDGIDTPLEALAAQPA